MFRKILIANRGEIACRVIRTARRMGIATVAVFSEADAGALPVQQADEAFPIGAAPARDSYLQGARIIEVAQRAGAEAVHPGYGFLSENAEFAEACAAAGLVFIGPPPAAIRAMGSKSAAKALMEAAGVALVPGYHGAAQDFPTLRDAAARIGYPVLIKASAGGGGKGMRVVAAPEALEAAIDAAKREAASSFGDDHVLIEKYLTSPRHIEIQIFADTQGHIVSLFERDCSVQRRHQKVLEEAPSPLLNPAQRQAMGAAAMAAARAVGYVGAGTVEFIVQDGDFHFMEMNTRLQVEHPVTEMVTGLDLVEWQLRVAAGEKLPQAPAAPHGHAFEARVYAEDPARDFLPSIGRLVHLRQPQPGPDVRVETGVREGDAITAYYDPMIAKLVAWGTDREAARRRLSAALAEYQVVGVQTNLGLLRAIVDHPLFAAGDFDTGFIARHAVDLLPAPDATVPDVVWAAASLQELADPASTDPADPHSPWAVADGWRMNLPARQSLSFAANGRVVTLLARPAARGGFDLQLPHGPVHAQHRADGIVLNGVPHRLHVHRHGDRLTVILQGRNHVLHRVDPLAPPAASAATEARVIAPIPARVARVLVQVGDAVRRGAPLLVLEAMKMEITLSAPADGVVEAVRAQPEEMVQEGAELVSFTAPPSTQPLSIQPPPIQTPAIQPPVIRP